MRPRIGASSLWPPCCISASPALQDFFCCNPQNTMITSMEPAIGGVNSPQGRSIAKPQPIRPRIGALSASAPVPSRTLNGFHADGQRAGSASPSTQDNDEEPRCVFKVALVATVYAFLCTRSVHFMLHGMHQHVPCNPLHTRQSRRASGSVDRQLAAIKKLGAVVLLHYLGQTHRLHL